MKSEHQHIVLVVDDDEPSHNAIDHILQIEKIECIFAGSGESALEQIEKTKKPFALIIAHQRLGGMKGTQFLEQAKMITPNSIRFLITAHPETQTLINAVNMGTIQRYLAKPWEKDNFVKAIRSGILLYEFFLDNEKLLNLAKNQNTKLYDLNCELMETTKSHNKMIRELDSDIEIIENEIKTLSSQQPITTDTLMDEIQSQVKNDQGIDSKKIKSLLSNAIKTLYDQFNELAHRNGFEMPDIKGEIK